MFHSVSSVVPAIEVSTPNKSIFRLKALRSYSDREQQPVSYTLGTPRSLYFLWALLALIVFFGVMTWLTRIPVYTAALAVAVHEDASQNETTPANTIVILVSADQLDRLRVGQNVVFTLNKDHHRVAAQIFAVEAELLSPQAARKRFDPGVLFPNIVEPKAVAFARLVPPASSAWLFDDRGSSINAWVETDSKPVLSLFPLRACVSQPGEPEAIGPIAFSGLVRVSQVRKGELFEYPLRALSCLLREKSLQIKNQQQNEGGSLYV